MTEWEVLSTGADCTNTGWLTDRFEAINGKIVSSKVSIKKDKFSWGKVNCKTPIFYEDKDFVLEFFDGAECRTNPGELPSGCAELMKKSKGNKVDSYSVSCSGTVVLPESYHILSKDYVLAIAESDYITKTLKKNPGVSTGAFFMTVSF